MFSPAEGKHRTAADAADPERTDAAEPKGTVPGTQALVYPVPPRVRAVQTTAFRAC